jgi:hypothetical protein
MPFIDERRTPQNLANLLPTDEPMGDPTMVETFGAAFRTQNMVGSFLTSRGMPDPFELEDGFDGVQYFIDQGMDRYVEEGAGVFNRKAADARIVRIKQEEQDRRTLDAAGGLGVVAEMAAGVVDLPSLLPIGGGVVAGVARSALRIGIGAGLDAAVSEAGLQATQFTRTGEETALNIGGSIILGGALGALAGRLASREVQTLSRKIEQQGDEFEAVDNAFRAIGRAQSAGAAARDTGPLRLKDEHIIANIPGVNRQDPMIRLQLSDLDEARGTVRDLAETPLEYAENAGGMATTVGGSVETRIKMWNAPLANALRNIDTGYARYFHGAPEPNSWQVRLSPLRSEFARHVQGDRRLTYAEFKREVSKAAFSGEKHQIPEVAAAAAEYRKIDDLMKQAAIDAGLFPEDVAVKGDVSHLFRMYNRQKIIARRDQFAAILQDHFKAKQQAAAIKADEMRLGQRIADVERRQGQYDQAFARLSSIEDRLGGRKAVRGNKLDDLERQRQTRFDVMRERAPDGVVKALRGADDQASLIDAVREARKAERSQAKKKRFADTNPVLFTIRQKGGVRVGSQLDSELRSMGVTPKTNPGLFRKNGGLGDVDNLVSSEYDFFANLPQDGNGYVDRNAVFDAIREEVAGRPLQTIDEQAAQSATDELIRGTDQWLESVGLGANAMVKDVRDYIKRVLGAERDLDGLDARISRLERELDDFDAKTEELVSERDISSQEAATIAKEVEALDAELADVADLANASPRVSIIVDMARTKRDLFKAKLKERTISRRVDAITELEKAGRANERLMAELAAKSIDLERAGQDIGKLKAKADKLEKMAPKRGELDRVDEFANLSDDEIKSLVDETINTILGNAEGRIPYDSIVSGPRGPLKERMLSIESERIADFMELDIEKVLHAQTRTMSADVELTKKFGSVDLAEQIRKINDEADAKIRAATSDKERQKLEKARTDAVRDVEGIRDRLRGQYQLPDNPDGIVLRAGRVVRNLNYLRLLGGMTVSAIPDIARPVMVHGLTGAFRDGFMPMVRNFKAFRLAADEVKAAGTALDMVLDSRTMAMADIGDQFGRHTRFERGLAAATNRFGLVSLMAPWNATMKQFSGMLTMTNMLRAAQRVAEGKGSAKELRNLAASGIDADMAARIAKQFAQFGDEQGGVLLAKAADWDDELAREAFRAAVVRDVDRTIVTPGQDKPLWMSTEAGKMIGQFKSFGISSMQKVALSGMQQRDAATLNGVVLMLALGALTYQAKSWLSGKETSDKPFVWAVEAFDRSGLAGWLMEVNNASEKITRGKVGFSALTGEQVSRYASRNATASLLGPSLGTVQDMLTVLGAGMAGEYGPSEAKKLRQLIPAQNVFYLRSLFDKIERALGGDSK